MLLRDDVLVRRYQNGGMGKDEFVRTVLRDWLSRDDSDPNDLAVPRTWAALAECVTDAGLDGTLTRTSSLSNMLAKSTHLHCSCEVIHFVTSSLVPSAFLIKISSWCLGLSAAS